jgi:hypothetical protein
VEIANGAKCFGAAVHGIPAERAMNVKIDKTGREIVSVKVDNILWLGLQARGFTGRMPVPRLTNLGDFPFFHDNFEAIANSIEKNQTRVCEDHVA